MKSDPIVFVLAGGQGKRLMPLTGKEAKRAKPAVKVGTYPFIDFVLSNVYHSGLRKVCVLTQYETRSLHDHIRKAWYDRFGNSDEEFIRVLPAMQGEEMGWYEGSADALRKNLDFVNGAEIINILSADQVYLMDIEQMNNYHLNKKADLTIAAIPIKKELAANRFGVIIIDENWQVKGFEEKPANPTPMPGNKDLALISIGIYAADSNNLIKDLIKYKDKHDIGGELIPTMLEKGRKILAYNFMDNNVPGVYEKNRGYWRDVGTIKDLYETTMEIREALPPIDLYNKKWLVLTRSGCPQPAKFVGSCPKDSIVSNGVIVSKSVVERSVLGYNVRIEDDSEVKDSIFLGDSIVKKGAKVRGAIVDCDVVIPAGETVGINKQKDKARGFYKFTEEDGIPVVPRGYKFE